MATFTEPVTPPSTIGFKTLAARACLNCESESELLVFLLIALGAHHSSGYNLPADTNKLINDSACVACYSDKRILEIVVALIANLTQANTNTVQTRAKYCQLFCANPKQIHAALALLINNIGLPA